MSVTELRAKDPAGGLKFGLSKIGRITPLHKRKEDSKAKNYRPVIVVPND